MYRSCIYCSAQLGSNESVEAFPVGKTLAFDAAKGRLWAVCPKCARWNLSPIEERWEPVEAAEKLFRDARLRVQSENVGLAKLRDGTRLIRVGEAVAGELAVWRYGRTLAGRRKRYLAAGAATVMAGAAMAGGLFAISAPGLLGGMANLWRGYQQRKVVYRLPGSASPDGRAKTIRRWHVERSWLGAEEGEGTLQLHVPGADHKSPRTDWRGKPMEMDGGVLLLTGETARRALSRAMVRVNAKGAKRPELDHAVGLLASGGAEEFIRRTARDGHLLGEEQRTVQSWRLSRDQKKGTRRITPVSALALEMALHEEEERRALSGELALLESAWREAEEIAGIADGLAARMMGIGGASSGPG